MNQIKLDTTAPAVAKIDAASSQITLDENSAVPLWMQLRNRITYLIVSGAYPAGAQLPSVRELALELNLNYNTVNKVFRDIERDGYVLTRRGRGTFVAEVNTQDGTMNVASAAEQLVDGFFEECRELGLSQQEAAALVAKRAGGLFV